MVLGGVEGEWSYLLKDTEGMEADDMNRSIMWSSVGIMIVFYCNLVLRQEVDGPSMRIPAIG